MDNLRGFEKRKGSLQRSLIGRHVALASTSASSLYGLRDITSSMNSRKRKEDW